MSALFVTDAPGFGDSITVVMTYDHTSPDGHITTTGSATFTYTRTRLADHLAHPKLLCGLPELEGHLGAHPLETATFLAVACATGKMPGWVIYFGPQDYQPNVFTRTTNDPAHPDNPPLVSTFGTDCILGMTCTLAAPGRKVGAVGDVYGGRSEMLGLVPSYFYLAPGAVQVDDANCTVELIQPGMEATSQGAAVNPVYRVTLPAEAEFIGSLVLMVNGSQHQLMTEGYVGGWPGYYADFSGGPELDGGADLNPMVIYPRSATVYDIQMKNLSDTLAPGTLSYRKNLARDSFVQLGGDLDYLSFPIPDPFHLSTVTYPTDDNGLSVEVRF